MGGGRGRGFINLMPRDRGCSFMECTNYVAQSSPCFMNLHKHPQKVKPARMGRARIKFSGELSLIEGQPASCLTNYLVVDEEDYSCGSSPWGRV